MTAKEYLNEIRTLDSIIRQKKQQLDDLRAIATAIRSFNYAQERVQTSPAGEAPFAKTAEKVAELDREIRGLEDDKLERINRIHALHDRRYIEVLYKRYVEGLTFEKIAGTLTYSTSTAYRLHGEALEKLEEGGCFDEI